MSAATILALTLAVSPRWAFEAAYDNVEGGDWYMHLDNETANLAWGESYVLHALVAMARRTGHPIYFDRLVRHLDALLEMRDDARGVADYRGVSGACWRNTSYQPQGQPYCYAVHSGMLIYPMAEFVGLVADWRHRDVLAYDGLSYAAKAETYLAAAVATVAYHEDEWSPAGHYFFRPDATFLPFAGDPQPLNQSNAMGLALVALHAVTDEPAYRDHAAALAQAFKAQITAGPDGAYLWNYYGGPYAADGEDISHAAINVEFAVRAADAGIVFTAADLDAFATTFLERVYRDDATFSDFVGGGPTNSPDYRAQIGRWLPLTPRRTAVYTAVHDAFARDYPPEAIGSGSVLLGWAHLAALEPPVCPPFFYPYDWQDQGDHQEATAYGANVLTTPPDLAAGCRVPLTVSVPRTAKAAQWDGTLMHRATTWQPTAGFVARSVPYEPRWPLVYYQDGVLFEFQDTFVAGDGILVRHPPVFTPPSITSLPPTDATLDVPLQYTPTGAGDPPFWWSLADGPVGLAVDPATGVLEWTPTAPGDHPFTLTLENDLGLASQQFTIHVEAPAESTTSSTTTDAPTTTAADETSSSLTTDLPTTAPDPTASGDLPDTTSTTSSEQAPDDAGCGCRTPAAPPSLALLALLARRRRRALPLLTLITAQGCKAPEPSDPADASTTGATTDPAGGQSETSHPTSTDPTSSSSSDAPDTTSGGPCTTRPSPEPPEYLACLAHPSAKSCAAADCTWYTSMRFPAACGNDCASGQTVGVCVAKVGVSESGCYADTARPRLWHETPAGVQVIQHDSHWCYIDFLGWEFCGEHDEVRPECACLP